MTPLTAAQARHALGQMPVSFQPNVGQADASVAYLTHTGGASVFLSPTQAVWAAVAPHPVATAQPHGRPQPSAPVSGNALRMEFVRGNASAQATTGDELPGVLNYLTGSDPAQWHTNIPTFGRVTFHDVYPGIDVAWYGNQGKLEYDFIVAPGADPSVIDLAFAGANGMTIDAGTGDLVLSTSIGEVRQHAPQVFQDINGLRMPVAGAFVHRGVGHVGFGLGAYARSQTLVIDPVFGYSTLVAGGGNEEVFGTATDSSGDAYITGATSSTHVTTPGAFQTTPGDLFVSKLDPTGSALAYSTYLGPAGASSRAFGLGVDAHGDAFVAGYTSAPTFPTTSGAFQTTCPSVCAFVTKLNAAGSSLGYSTFLGGPSGTLASGIAVDAGGDAFMGGVTFGTDYPTTPGAYNTTCSSCVSGSAGVLTQLNPAGSALVYSTYLPGVGFTRVALDHSGHAYVGGQTTSTPTDFPTTTGAFQTTCVTNGCAYVTKFTADGSALVYSTFLAGTLRGAGSGGTLAADIAVDAAGDAYVAGDTDASDFPVTPHALQTVIGPGGGCTPCSDAFVTKLNPSGGGLLYSTYLGGQGPDHANSVALDSTGDFWVAGSTRNPNFYSKDPLQTLCPCFVTSNDSLYVAKIRPASLRSKDLLFSSFLGGTGFDGGREYVSVDSHDNVYLGGSTNAPDASDFPPGDQVPFPTTSGAFQTAQPAGKPTFYSSAFVTKIGQVCSTPIIGNIPGDVVVGRGSAACLNGAKVSGSVTVQRGGDLSIDNSTISGSITTTGASSVTVCATTVGAGVTLSGTTGFVRMGSGEAVGCQANHITGDVTLRNNRAGFEFGGNIVAGNSTLDGNTGSAPTWDDTVPEVEANRISGNLVCAGNSPAPISDLAPNRAAVKTGQCASL